MRVLVVTTSYPRYPEDPAGHFVAGLNRYLRCCGHTVEVLAAAELGGPSPVALDADAVRRVPSSLFYHGGAPEALFASWQQGAGRAAAVEALRFSAALGRLLWSRRGDFDAVVSHWLLPCGLLAALLAGGRPQVAIAHSSDVHLLRRWRLLPLGRLVARRARLVYTCSSLRLPGAAGVVVPMGIDVAAFAADAPSRQAARKRLGVGSPTVLFLGRLVAVKGVGLLLAVLARQPMLNLWIAGDGPQRAELEQAVATAGLSQRVRFFGEVAEAARRDLLLACDALALPSLRLPDGRTDGAPQVVLEGLAAGCAVVASAVGGVAELIGAAGWLVAAGDVAALATALTTATGLNGAARHAQQQRAVARARRFDWAVVAPQILGSVLSSALPK